MKVRRFSVSMRRDNTPLLIVGARRLGAIDLDVPGDLFYGLVKFYEVKDLSRLPHLLTDAVSAESWKKDRFFGEP
jgi:hypothetical protein